MVFSKKDLLLPPCIPLFRNFIFQTEIRRRSCGGAQPNISEQEITSISIPLPPKAVQDEIATEVQHRMATAKQLKAEAKQALETAKHQVEALLFGA